MVEVGGVRVSERVAAEPGTWLVGRIRDEQVVTPVNGWLLGDNSVSPLTLILPGEDAILVKGSAADALKVAAMRELVEMAERATTLAQFELLERARGWVMNWEPQSGK